MLVQATVDDAEDKTDPVFAAFLGFVEHQMRLRPDLITSVTRGDRREADEILRGVRASADEDLGDDFGLPGTRPSRRPRARLKRHATT
jgi:hypothetical protein